MTRCRLRVSFSVLAVVVVASFVTAPTAQEPSTQDVLNAAKEAARTIPGQALALAGLAWPADGDRDPLVQAAARKELVAFGHHGLAALRQSIKEVDSVFSGDVTAALIEARRKQPGGNPPDFLPGLEEAIWFGSIEARRLGMIELSRYRYPPAVLSIIDAVHLHPELTATGIRSLGRMGNERGRFFLKRVLEHGNVRYKHMAAQSLGLIGETGLPLLRQAAESGERSVREAAVAALAQYATADDVAVLNRYLALYGDDDGALRDAVRAKTQELATTVGGEPERP